MAVSDQQKIDFLLKKIGFTKTKTGSTVGTGAISGTPKQPFAEALPSPLVVPNSSLWNEADSIPATPPGSDTNQVKVYATASAVRMTADATSSGQRAYIAYSTYNDTSSVRLTNWIDTQFGALYLIKVFRGDPNSGGVALSSGATNENWFFDYSAGVLNFNDSNVPSGVNDTNIYIVGYRYIGQTGAPTSGISTFSYFDLAVERNLDVGVQGGISTFRNNIDANGIIEGIAGQNKIPFLYSNMSDLPSAGTYHGMFAHVHATGRGYFAHAGGWHELVNVETNGNVGTGTQRYLLGSLVSTSTTAVSLNVTGISTFGGNLDINSDVVIDGNIDLNGDIDVDGHTNLDNVSVAGVTTFNANVKFDGANAGRDITFERSQNSLVFADDALAKFGNSEDLKIFHDGDNSYIREVGTGSLILQSNETKIVNSANNETIAKFNENSSVELYHDSDFKFETTSSGVNVSGTTTTTGLAVSGVSTFTGAIDANGDLDVDGHTNLDNVSVAGVSTFAGITTVTGNTFFAKQSNVSGISTFGGKIDANGDLNVSGITTLTGDVTLNAGASSLMQLKFKNNITGFGANDGASVSYSTNSNSMFFSAFETAGNMIFQTGANSLNNRTLLISNTGVVTLQRNQKNMLVATPNSHVKLYYNDTERLSTSGIGITVTGEADVNGDLDVDGHTNLDNVSIAGFTTITQDLNVDGHTNLDNVSIAGITTISSDLIVTNDAPKIQLVDTNNNPDYEINANAGFFTIKDITNNASRIYIESSGTINLANNVNALAGLDATGNITATGNVIATGADINGDLDVDGHTNLDNVSIAGVSTFAGAIDLNADLDVDGHTNLDNISVSGVSTFAGDATFNGNVSIGGTLTYEDVKNVDSVGLMTARAGINVTGGVITALAAENKIPSLYSAMSNLPNAGTYHGMFAHVHATARGYFAHAGNWMELVNKEINGVVGTGTETYNIGNLVSTSSTTTSLNVSGVTTTTTLDVNGDLDISGTLKGYDYLVAPHGGTITITVTVASKTSAHRYNGTGSGDGFVFDGFQAPFITLTPGRTYKFDQSDNSNSSHPIRFYLNADRSIDYTDGVTTSGTPGSSGAYTQIVVTDKTPTVLHYQCQNHSYMGNAAQLNSSAVVTTDDAQIYGNLCVKNSGISTFTGQTNIENGFSVSGVSTFSNDVIFTGDSYNLTWDKSDNKLKFAEYSGIRLGNNNELQIDHRGTSYILNIDSNPLVIGSNTLQLTDASTLNNFIYANTNTVILFQNDVEKLRTKDYGIQVTGTTDTDGLIVSGVSTFTGAIDANGDLDVDGHTNLDNVSIAGVTTFSSDLYIAENIIHTGDTDTKISFPSNDTIKLETGNNYITVDDSKTVFLRNIRVGDYVSHSGVDSLGIKFMNGGTGNNGTHVGLGAEDNGTSGGVNHKTFRVYRQGSSVNRVNIDNFGNLNALQGFTVAGISTFNGNVDIDADLDVDGHTNLDNVNIAGVTTCSSQLNMLDNAMIRLGSAAASRTSIYYDSSGSNTWIKNFNDTLKIGYRPVEIYYVNQKRLEFINGGNRFTNDVTTTFMGDNYHASWSPGLNKFQLNDNAKLAFGSQADATIHHNNANLLISNTTGNINVTGNVVLNNDISVDGHTELDNVNIAGVVTATTFVGNGDFVELDVDGHTNLDNISVAGVSTFAGNADFSSGVDVTGDITATGDIRIQGTYPNLTFLDTNNDSDFRITNANGKLLIYDITNSATRFTVNSDGHIDINGDLDCLSGVDISQDLDVDGHTNLDNLSVAGVSTFSDAATFSDTVTHNSTTSLNDDVTFTGASYNALWDKSDNALEFNDNTKATFGTDVDLSIYHDGSNSYIVEGGTGSLYIRGADVNIETVGGNKYFTGASNVAKLYHTNNEKLATTSTGINVTGLTDTDTLTTGNATFTGTIIAGGSSGSNGQYLKSTGTGVAWENYPAARTTQSFTASSGQTTFSFSYNVGYLDVFVNGVKLSSSEFTATNGTSVVLSVGSFVGDIVELVSYNTIVSGGGGGGISNVVEDTTPQLGGNLELLNNSITGTGNINVTGIITATNFVGDGSGLTGITASGSGVIVKDSGSTVGTAGTINFGDNLSVSPASAGIVTITAGIDTSQFNVNKLDVSGISTFKGNIDVNADLDVDGHTNLDNISVAGVSTFTGTLNANQLKFSDSNGSSTNIALFGDSNDLKIYHNGSHSIVQETGSGGLLLLGSVVEIGVPSGSEKYFRAVQNGAAELYHNNVKRLETTSVGVSIPQDLHVDGHTELDNVNIAGVVTATTFKGALQGTSGTFSSDVDITGDLDVNGHTDLDNVSIAGVVTATTFVGALTGNASGNAATATALQNARTIGGVSFDGTANINLPGVNATGNQDTSGTAAVATNVTVSANNTANETVYPVFVDGAIGSQGAETDIGLTYNPSTGNLTATKFTGDGSGLTGITASGSGIVIKHDGSTVGTAGTINFGTNLDVSAISGGAVTITASGGSGSGISTISGVVNIANDLDVDGHTNLDNVSVAGISTFSAGANTLNVNCSTTNPAINIQYSGSTKGTLTPETDGLTIGVNGTNNIFMHLSQNGGSGGDFIVKKTGTELFKISGTGEVDIANDLDVDGHTNLDNVSIAGVCTATSFVGDGSALTGVNANVGITTNLSGTFTASAGSPSTINTFGYGSGDVVVEYTVFIKNGSNFQTQKLLAMRDGTTIHSTQFAVMFSSSLLVQLDATISSGNILLRATPETGVSGSTTYKVKREVM